MIQVGSKVKDLITGFVGVAVGRTEWLYGCARIVCEPLELKDGKPPESLWFDEQRIEEVQANFAPVSPPRCGVDIQLGNKVRDKITGFEGMAVAKTIWSSGNVTIQIESQKLHEGKPIDSHGFDYARLELVEVAAPPVSAQNSALTGGPQNDPKPTNVIR